MGKKETLYDKTDKKLRRISGTIGAIMAIVAAATGICTWVSNQFQSVVSEQITELREEIQASDIEQTQAITRLELMNLMKNDPTNVAAIEKMARYYFWELKGDQYMTGKYSIWCREYGGDPSIIVGVK